MSWTSVIVIAKLASRDRGLSLSWSWWKKKWPYFHVHSFGWICWICEMWCSVYADRGIDSQLIGWGCFIVQRPDHGDSAAGPIDWKERRRRLEGEENATSCALVWICRVHHKHWSSHWCVLKNTFKKTHTHKHKLWKQANSKVNMIQVNNKIYTVVELECFSPTAVKRCWGWILIYKWRLSLWPLCSFLLKSLNYRGTDDTLIFIIIIRTRCPGWDCVYSSPAVIIENNYEFMLNQDK